MRDLDDRSATGGHLDRDPQSGTGPRGGPQNIHWPTGLEDEATPVTALAGWDVTAEELALAGAVGASGGRVYSVALGDLDHDGDLDIVSGSDSGEDYEVIVRENDGSPFSGLWSQHDAGSATDHIYSVALGDLEHDGDLDIVSGSGEAKDYEIIAWLSRTGDCCNYVPLAEKK